MDTLVPPWFEFKNSIAETIWFLYLQPLTNCHFHFPIEVSGPPNVLVRQPKQYFGQTRRPQWNYSSGWPMCVVWSLYCRGWRITPGVRAGPGYSSPLRFAYEASYSELPVKLKLIVYLASSPVRFLRDTVLTWTLCKCCKILVAVGSPCDKQRRIQGACSSSL